MPQTRQTHQEYPCLNGVPQGDGDSQRDGRITYMHSVQIHGRIHTFGGLDFDSPSGDEQCRVMLVLDRQTNKTDVDPEEVMMEPNSVGDDLSFRVLSNTERFDVLAQWRVRLRGARAFLRPQIPGVTWPQPFLAQYFDGEYLFKEPVVVNYKDEGAEVDSITDNSIFLIDKSL